MLKLYFGVEIPGRERYSCTSVNCLWKFFFFIFLFWNSQPQAITWTQLSRTEFCVHHPMTAVNWARNPWNTSNKPQGHIWIIPPRHTASGEKSLNILDSKSSASLCIVHNLKCERLSYFKLPWNSVSVIWIYLTFYLAFVFKQGVLLYPCVNSAIRITVVHVRTRGSFYVYRNENFSCISWIRL